ncbi:OmpA family protein [Nesterenkonia ebinurensis]|uniref:OmpA family protein n=1 Tax=Nesterenkonia ebinurensis TaxID=2608252 RepID=UPI00168B9CAF|nr:OmpA family protein [Nesterenkonia ebinurensis]
MSELAARRRGTTMLTAAVLSAGLLLSTAAPGVADDEQPTEPPEAPEEIGSIDDFIVSYQGDEFIRRYDGAEFVHRLGSGERQEQDLIVLETDILFSSNEWELPENAGDHLAELVEQIPEGASVTVHGHTDSRPVNQELYDFDNQELSENRAQAVADALEEKRPDLQLTVAGFGDSEPAVDEDEDDPSTFAANRRVEIRYDG